MLDIFESYHCMQIQGKLMNQTLENGKKPSFGTDFGWQFFFSKIWPHQLLDTMASYHHERT